MSSNARDSSTGYQPFPDVAMWAKRSLDMSPVDRLGPVVEALLTEQPSILERAVNAVKRVAAIETGAIENLYEHDRGITITAAMTAATIDSLREKLTHEKHAYIECQLQAYDFVLDLVTKAEPVSAAKIRELHQVLCATQATYVKYGADGGKQDAPLTKGQYKTEDNHVLLSNGALHYYAPHFNVEAEVNRLVENLRSIEFEQLHPVDQASYIHYAFVAIHPFSDGNGRVARALSSIATYRHYRVPLLITFDQRGRYFDALEAADKGDTDFIRRFIRDRVEESVVFLVQSIKHARADAVEIVAQRIASNNRTRGGFSHFLVDQAARDLLAHFESELIAVVNDAKNRPAGLTWNIARVQSTRDARTPRFRRTISSPPELVQVHGVNAPPASAEWAVHVGAEIPIDADESDAYILECGSPDAPALSLPVPSLLPQRTLMADMRIKLFAEEVIRWVGEELDRLSASSIAKQGYMPK